LIPPRIHPVPLILVETGEGEHVIFEKRKY